MPKARAASKAPSKNVPKAPPTSQREARRLAQQSVGRTQLLDAAEHVFGRKGFHETTLKEVADLAEFSVGSVYSFFENKDDLFRQIFVRRGEQFMPGIHEILDEDASDPVEQLHRLIDFEIGFFRAHPHFGRIYLRYSNAASLSLEREIDVVMTERYEEAMRLQAALFERGQRARKFRRGDSSSSPCPRRPTACSGPASSAARSCGIAVVSLINWAGWRSGASWSARSARRTHGAPWSA